MVKIKELPLTEIEKLESVHNSVFHGGFDRNDYLTRLAGKKYMILVAEDKGEIIGFKAGYERDGLYSWMGGVREDYRGKKIGTKLADAQEKWAKEQGYDRVWFKTYEDFPEMIAMGEERGFVRVREEFSAKRQKTAFVYEKRL